MWYQEELGEGRTFRLYDTLPEICKLPHDEAWYARDAWRRLLDGGLHDCAPVSTGRKQFHWVVYADIDEPCPAPFNLGRGWNRLTMLGRWDLLGLTAREFVAGYAHRPAGFPQSAVLCGVRDVRDYRIHSGSGREVITGSSAFNIKTRSLRLGCGATT